VLGLAGVGPKAIQNIYEQIEATTFPELPVEAPEAVAEVPTEEAVVAGEETPVAAAPELVAGEAIPVGEGALEVPSRGREVEEEVEAENAKDGVSLDELFKMKPEIFHTAAPEEEDAEKKKGKKKKKGVELVLDEELGEVVGRKKHKRGEDEIALDE
jgi:hypothetical protein